MTVLLTDEAVKYAASEVGVPEEHDDDMRQFAGAFLRYHATEGREALVERVARALAADDPDPTAWEDWYGEAETAVTALFEQPDGNQ